jgi:DNA-binding NarL/FixJ family response regulator
MIRLLVVDDHKLFRQGVVNLLKSTKDFEVVGEAESGKDAVMLAVALDPDVIVLDLGLPDISGIDVVKEIQARGLTAKVVMLTMHKDKGYLDMARRLGITSYLLKDDAFEDLLYAIKAVNSGSTYISSSFQKNIISSLPLTANQSLLTPREKEIATLIAKGFTSNEIANSFSRSTKTIETHRRNIKEKLGVKNLAEIVHFAIDAGLIRPGLID